MAITDPALRRPWFQPVAAAPLLLAAYQALCLNAPELAERVAAIREGGASPGLSAATVAAEAGLVLGICLLIAVGLAALGRWVLLVGGTAMILLSAAASYYMVRYDVVIGYGIVQAVVASDQALSVEKLGHGWVVWMLLLGVVPAALWAWWSHRQAEARGGRPSGRLWRLWMAIGLAALTLLAGGQALVRQLAEQLAGGRPVVSPPGLVAHRYVPTNWLAGLAMTGANRVSATLRAGQLSDPAQRFAYREQTPLDDVTVVLVIGETTRHDHLGLFGYDRDTTPRLREAKGLVGFRAESCDTSTRLSLACMFVRPEGILTGQGFEPDRVEEHKVFSVFRKLGFSIELFAMQSEVGFYQRVEPDFYKMREVIVADASSSTQQVHDGLLLPEVESSLKRHADGRHLIVLHKKGSHFLYSQRYPRQFARWQPECLDADDRCGRTELVNAYDNSVLYGDHVMGELLARLQDRKAMVVFTSDHGESIGDGMHFHGTPRAIAPPEQRRVPLLFWGSPQLLADPVHAETFERLRQQAQRGEVASHQNLFASLLGCLSVTSPDGGITPQHNLCR